MNIKHAKSKSALLLSVAVMLLCAMTVAAQSAMDKCRPASVIPLASEPPAKIVIDPPLAGPLAARGVVVIQYCAENLHLAPVFGPDALAVSPRVGHIHVRVDDASWVWADASGNPIILMGLSPGPHKVLIELEDANHRTLDKGTVKFVVPEKTAAEEHHGRGPAQVSNHSTRSNRGQRRPPVRKAAGESRRGSPVIGAGQITVPSTGEKEDGKSER